ncbi:30S ribosomal protein S16 [Spirobacillus cienkowskii]|jgi:small subunit ribosomal protein S16|uniref:Small ribosomal subunit protein bS16 n=1 Tax=Spirobacillus cienkowskii TaxID=495820 RepID=A0A369KYT3_9BACT|nr:MAG: 30S ribosomal protein S16 [Spirobacillus cienkowskii]
MSLKFRLQRHGRKGRAFYHIVVTDSRNARNGRFIEQVGYYDPTPANSIAEVKTDRMAHWYKVGCRPTNAVENILKNIKKVDLNALAKSPV